jgi:hypothetical protein
MNWKQIPEAPRYRISSEGAVYSTITNEIKKSFVDEKGYLRVQLYIDGGAITRKVHRLVAEAFVENPNNKPQVNHMDGNKQNNHVANLEWTTGPENMAHARALGLYSKRSDIYRLAAQFKRAILDGYYAKDIAMNHSLSPKTLRKLISSVEPSNSYPEVKTGGRKSYIYFDGTRNKWRTDIRGLGLSDRQFELEADAAEFVQKALRRVPSDQQPTNSDDIQTLENPVSHPDEAHG